MPARRALAALVILATGMLIAPAAARVDHHAADPAVRDHGDARRGRRAARRGRDHRAHEPIRDIDRPRQPVGRSACARLPDHGSSRSRSTARRSPPSGPPRSTCACPSTTSSRERPRRCASHSASMLRAARTPSRRAPAARTASSRSANGSPSSRPSTTSTASAIPQISFTAESIRLELTTTTPLARDAVACPGLVAAPDDHRDRVDLRDATDVRDFSFVVNPRFRLTERTVDGVELRVYTETVSGGTTADLAATALTDAVRSLRSLSVGGPRPGRGRLGRRVQHGVPAHDPSDPWQGRRHLRRLPRGRAPVVLRAGRQRPAGRAMARRGVRRLQRALADGDRGEPVLGAAGRQPRSSPGRPARQPAATGRAATATSTPSSIAARSSSTPCAPRWATTPSSARSAPGSRETGSGTSTGERLLGHLQAASPTDLVPVFRGYLAEPRPRLPVRAGMARPI